jgi:hypothetical protein
MGPVFGYPEALIVPGAALSRELDSLNKITYSFDVSIGLFKTFPIILNELPAISQIHEPDESHPPS